MDKDYLPQFAAEAVRDLERVAKAHEELAKHLYGSKREQAIQVMTANYAVATTLRSATHVVLPPNGEIYRDTRHTGPTDQECVSMAGIPAPIVSFEYPWTHPLDGNLNGTYERNGQQSKLENPSKRITLVIDGKQFIAGDISPDEFARVIFVSVCFYDTIKAWAIPPYSLSVFNPLTVSRRVDPVTKQAVWGTQSEVMDMLTSTYLDANSMQAGTVIFSEYQADISIVAQACHALHVGATLEGRKDKSYTRTRSFEKAGVGGFEYHVLKLPHGTVKETLGTRSGGERDGPRYHFRRAHLRTLSKGTQTFVRSCFVGNRDKGIVEKEYKVDAKVTHDSNVY